MGPIIHIVCALFYIMKITDCRVHQNLRSPISEELKLDCIRHKTDFTTGNLRCYRHDVAGIWAVSRTVFEV